MNLREARVKFTLLVAEKLIPRAYELGFEPAFDAVKAKDGHNPYGLHPYGCALDLLLYLNAEYLIRTEEYRQLGEYWESLDPNCRWGGRLSDGNHFSYSPPELFGSRV